MIERSDPVNSRQAQEALRRLLLEWDAIGVRDEDDVWDEYDCMIGPLLHLLAEGSDEQGLVRWIQAERQDHFGLDPDPPADADLAAKSVAWWHRRDGR